MMAQGESVQACAEIPLFRDMDPAELQGAMAETDLRAFRGIWSGVILSQWNLVFHPWTSDTALQRHQARAWFGGRDFRIACDFAGVDAAAVMEAFRVHLDMQERAGGELPPTKGMRGQARSRVGSVARVRREAMAGMRERGLLPPVAVMARIFNGVSRDVIYRDLEALGFTLARDVRRAA